MKLPENPTPSDAFGVPAGSRIPVVNSANIAQRGWVDWNVMNPAFGAPPPDLAPVYDNEGHRIAYWGHNYGWLSDEQVAAPGFDEQALARADQEHAREVAKSHGMPTGS